MSKKRTALTIAQKRNIIDYKEANLKCYQSDLARHFSIEFKEKISRRAIGDILKNKEKIIADYRNNK